MMEKYVIFESELFSREAISESAFGANLVASYDTEFAGNEQLLETLASLGISNLRFPGGSVTERAFCDAVFKTGDWDARFYDSPKFGSSQLTTLSDFFSISARIDSDAQLVIPTRIAFEESAGQALAAGRYGDRNEVTKEYIELVKDFVTEAIKQAKAKGVEISRFEIGNEFWGSGEMTAAEYAHVAVSVTRILKEDYPEIPVISQITAGAYKFSPAHSTEVFLEPDGNGDFIVHLASELKSTPPESWLRSTMPGSGTGANQTLTIAEIFLEFPPVGSLLDGVVDHIYFDDGFAGIDVEKDFALSTVYKKFVDALGVTEIDYFATEWGSRNPRSSNDYLNLGNANGLQYAHTTVEAFFELISNGVDGANFWPVTFGNPQTLRRVLVDTAENDLTFGGVAFKWMADSIIGLSAKFDFEVSGEIDVHGFGDDANLVLFVGDRAGSEYAAGRSIIVDLNEFSFDGDFFVKVSNLNSDGGFDEISANPVTTYSDGYMSSGSELSLTVSPWDLARVEIQYVTLGNDNIEGGNANDRIIGLSGHDNITGGGGNDELRGQTGNDYLSGNVGDDIIFGGDGDDVLFGGEGSDKIFGGNGADRMDGGSGDDDVIGGFGNDVFLVSEGDDSLDGGSGIDSISCAALENGVNIWMTHSMIEFGDSTTMYSGMEVFFGSEHIDFFSGTVLDGDKVLGATFFGKGGDDYFSLQATASSMVDGGDGDDTIMVYEGSAHVKGGTGDDWIFSATASLEAFGGSGNDTIITGLGNDRIVGGAGDDRLTGGLGRDVFVFGVDTGNDHISDFESQYDRIQLVGVDPKNVNTVSSEDGVTAHLSDQSSVFFANLSQDDLAFLFS